jgi:preprotein translocase subunit SecA
MNKQREVIYERRAVALEAPDLREEIEETLRNVVALRVGAHVDEKALPENWPLAELRHDLEQIALTPLDVPAFSDPPGQSAELEEALGDAVAGVFRDRTASREAQMGPEVTREFERWAVLANIDELWKEHLYELDGLKSGIGLRGYGGKDPVLEYKIEAFKMFEDMMDRVDEGIAKTVLKPFILRREGEEPERRRMVARREPAPMVLASAKTGGAPARPAPQRTAEKVGRNDPCPGGSGKKYKKCCGAE